MEELIRVIGEIMSGDHRKVKVANGLKEGNQGNKQACQN